MFFNCFAIEVFKDNEAKKPSREFVTFLEMLRAKMDRDKSLDPMNYNPAFITEEMENHYMRLFPFIKTLKGIEQEIAYILYHRNIQENFSKTAYSIEDFQIPSDETFVSLLSTYTKLPKLEIEILLKFKSRVYETPSHLVMNDDYNEYGDPDPTYEDDPPVSDYEYFADRYDYRDDE